MRRIIRIDLPFMFKRMQPPVVIVIFFGFLMSISTYANASVVRAAAVDQLQSYVDVGLAPKSMPEQESPTPVQVFDVQKERVITTRQNSPAFRTQVERWIQDAGQLSGRARLETVAGLIIRIPMNPPLRVRHPWLAVDLADAYLFIEPGQQENPHLLMISSEGKPYVIEVPENPVRFLKEHGLLRYIK